MCGVCISLIFKPEDQEKQRQQIRETLDTIASTLRKSIEELVVSEYYSCFFQIKMKFLKSNLNRGKGKGKDT